MTGRVKIPGGWRRPELLWAFLAALGCGAAAHGMGLTNKLSWHDDVVALFHVGTTISSGRWMLHVLEWLETGLFGQGPASTPLSHGIFALFCVAVSAALVTDLLSIRKKRYAAALGGLMAVFPVLTAYFGYMFTMPYYALALLLTTLAAWLICRGPWWAKAAAILPGGCAVGIYQAFVPLLVSLPLLYDISRLLEGKEPLRKMAGRILIQGLCAVGVMGFYLGMNRFFLAHFHLQMNSYMGLDQMESTSLGTYLARAGTAYREFFLPTRNVPRDMYPMHLHYLYLLMLCGDGVMAAAAVLRAWKQHRAGALLLAALFALMPLGCNLIFVMSETVHGLMTYGQTAQFALFLLLLDRLEIRREGARRAVSILAAGMLSMMGVMYIRFDNQCYLRVTFQQQQAISWFTTLVTRIKSTEGYQAELPVVFLNGENASDSTLHNLDELNFIHLDSYGDTLQEYINSYAWGDFMARWCGFDPPYGMASVWGEHPAAKEMPHYPDDGSIRRVEDVIIVNF